MAHSKWDHLTDADILGKAPDCETKVELAKALGMTESSFRSLVSRRGLNEQVADALRRAPVAVDDPQRVKSDQQDIELKGLRSENRELRKRLAGEEDFFDRIVEATSVPVEIPKYRTQHQTKSKTPNSAIAPIFDQQFGQFVRPSDTPGNRGAFSVEVFDRRLARYVDGVTGVLAKRALGYRLDELVLCMGGDHVEGDEIFPGQSWQLELDPPRQVWELALKMDTALREIVRFAREEVGVKKIGIYGVDDNHGAVGGKRAGARPKTYSWNWLFLKILFDRLRNDPIDQFAIEPGGSLFFRCAGHEFQLIHGHQIRGWGGLPFYGLTKFDGRSIRLHNRLYRYLLMGHHHQPGEIPNGAGETIVSGDWVGANNLSGVITAASRPQQKVLFVSRKLGVDATERIYFTDAESAYEQTPVYEMAA